MHSSYNPSPVFVLHFGMYIEMVSHEPSADEFLDLREGNFVAGEPLLVDTGSIQECASAHSSRSSICLEDGPQCRICFESGGEDLIAPCRCKGTQKFVHRSCLDNWRAAKEGFAFSHCTECRALFHLRVNTPADRWRLRLKFQLLVFRDYAVIFVVVQTVVILLGVLVYIVYGEELREMFGYDEHPYGFYLLAVVVLILVGLLYGFFIAIICGQRINNRHYHVLAKQELTKEYIVESLDEDQDPPPLAPNHVSNLRMFGLY